MFKPTKEHREQVSWYASCGVSKDAIACRLGIAKNTLEKYFALELEIGREAKRCERLDYLVAAAKSGNVSAIKELGLIQSRAALDESLTEGDQQAQEKPEKLGKKDAAQRLAKEAGRDTDWGNDLDPFHAVPN